MNILFFLHPKSSVTYLTLGNSLRQGIEKMRSSGYTEIPVVADEDVEVTQIFAKASMEVRSGQCLFAVKPL